jgi:hypothetical protein
MTPSLKQWHFYETDFMELVSTVYDLPYIEFFPGRKTDVLMDESRRATVLIKSGRGRLTQEKTN